LPERARELARDDPDLVRVALRALRQHLQILVGEQLGVGVAFVDLAGEEGGENLR
jgi:hypothetical protein